jgi:hypothetical protein
VTSHFSSACAIVRTVLSALKWATNVAGLGKPDMVNMNVLTSHLFTEIEETLGE